ncbi:MAG: tetratricopeptide repeat protein [Armatimonadota bacterium]|nr:tetratricopeptide repeat protein [Armatimonadota bacterium]MDW8026425.1 tetratricopeptide repeat protein [Armatimonadota bacterium]
MGWMRIHFAAILITLVLSMALTTKLLVCAEKEPPEKEPMVTLELKGTTVSEALSELSRQANVKVTLRGEHTAKLNLSIRNRRFKEALELICKLAQCGYCIIGDEYIVMPLPKPDELIKRIEAAWAGLKRFSCNAIERRWDGISWRERKIELLFSSPSSVLLKATSQHVGEEIWVIRHETTLRYLPEEHIAERWDENKCTDWGMMLGGPGNVAGFGQAWKAILGEYQASSVSLIALRDRLAYLLTLKRIKPKARYELLHCDCGVYGLGFYCSPIIRMVMEQPASVQLAFDVDALSLLHRAHINEDGNVIGAATADLSQPLKTGVPLYRRYELRDAANTYIGEYIYSSFGELRDDRANEFVLPQDVIVSDARLRSAGEYREDIKRTDNANLRFNLARLYLLKLGDPDEAISHLQAALEKNPQAPQLWLAYAKARIAAFKPSEAEAALRKAINLSPKLIEAHATLAEVLSAMGRWNEAIELLESVRQSVDMERASRLLLQKAVCYQCLGKLGEATELYLTLLSMPDADTNAAITSVERLLSIAHFAGDLTRLAKEAQSIAATKPSPFLHLLLMRIALELGDVDGASKHHMAFVRIRPHDLLLRLNAANAFMMHGALDEAENEYTAVVALHPLSPHASIARRQLSAIAIKRGQYPQAFGWLLAVERWLDGHAEMLDTVRSFEDTFMRYFSADALQVLAEACIERGMHREIIYTLVTDLRHLAADYDGTLTWARRGTARYPNNIWLKRAEVQALRDAKRWRDLEIVLRRECERNRTQPYFHAERIWLYYRWRTSLDLPRDRTEFATVLRNERNSREEFLQRFRGMPLSQFVYGIALANDIASFQSLPFEALSVLEGALNSQMPDGNLKDAIVTLRRALASCYGRIGKWASARAQYKALMRLLDDEFELAALAREWIAGEVSRKRFNEAISFVHTAMSGFEPMAIKRALLTALTELMVVPPDVMPLQRQLFEAEVNERLTVMQQWLNQNSTDPAALAIAGWVAIVRNDPKVATQHFETSMARSSRVVDLPVRCDLLELIGDGFAALGENQKAISAYEELVRLQPMRLSAHRKLLAIHIQSGNAKVALEAAKRMLAHSPTTSGMLFTYAQALALSGDTAQALKWLDRAITVAQVNADISLTELGTYMLTKAKLLEEMGKEDEAEKVYRQVALGAGIRRVIRRAAIEWLCKYYERRGDTAELASWLKWLMWAAPELQKDIEHKLKAIESTIKLKQ